MRTTAGLCGRTAGPGFFFGLALAVGVLLPGCGEAAAPVPLGLVDWPGRDGQPLPLDQPLRLEFDRPLGAPVRASAVVVLDGEERPASGLSMEAAGRFLTLTPALPLATDLDDGSLRPDTEYTIVLRGAPRLDGLIGADGTMLVGAREVVFRTLPLSDPGALAGGAAGIGQLRLLGVTADGNWQAVDTPAILECDGPLDPRTLEDAVLIDGDGEEIARLPMSLQSNSANGAVLVVDFGSWTGWGVLALPAGLAGPGGRELERAQRRLRVRRVP